MTDTHPLYRGEARKVCPRCKLELPPPYAFQAADGVTIATYCCPQHGDVVPRVSVDAPLTDWLAGMVPLEDGK